MWFILLIPQCSLTIMENVKRVRVGKLLSRCPHRNQEQAPTNVLKKYVLLPVINVSESQGQQTLSDDVIGFY